MLVTESYHALRPHNENFITIKYIKIFIQFTTRECLNSDK